MTSPPPPSESRGTIDYLDHVPSYNKFLAEYLTPLNPLIYYDPNMKKEWNAATLWTRSSTSENDHNDDRLSREPHIKVLVQYFRGARASVVLGTQEGYSGGAASERSEVILDEAFIETWYDATKNKRLLYLKDFHLCLERPDLEMYKIHDLFQDDWMNAYALCCTTDDYRFLYLGTDGTSTPFHHDVYLSHSWSTSLCGIKKWTMISPEYAHLLINPRTREPIPSLNDSGIIDEFEGKLRLAAKEKAVIVWQYPHETIFVPSGWFHFYCTNQTKNSSTLSINHNWANSSCLVHMYDGIAAQIDQAIPLLSDLQDTTPPKEFWQLIYDNMVRPSWGWNFEDFWRVVEWVVNINVGNPTQEGLWVIGKEVDPTHIKSMIRDLTERWLEREEAKHLEDVRLVVKTVQRKVTV